MRTVVEWIAAEGERKDPGHPNLPPGLFTTGVTEKHRGEQHDPAAAGGVLIEGMVAHHFPGAARWQEESGDWRGVSEGGTDSMPDSAVAREDELLVEEALEKSAEEKRQRRIYRGRTIEMLRRYLRYSIETGRLPSVLGQEFFRAKVTSYTVVTFEDRVIFVHDMERCLELLDEFSRQLIARRILQEHDQLATAKILHCTERTVRRLTPIALDLLSEILLDRGLLERLEPIDEKSCQGGMAGQNFVSACEESENNF